MGEAEDLEKELFYIEGMEGMEQIDEIWQNISSAICGFLKQDFLKQGIFPETDTSFQFKPDYSSSALWTIGTIREIEYKRYSETIMKETVRYLRGKIFLTRHSERLEPSFTIFIDGEEKTVLYDANLIKEIVKEGKKMENMNSTKLGKEVIDKLVYKSVLKEKEVENIMNEAKPALKQLGFSEEESNLMVLGAMESDNFKEGMKAEDIIAISLKNRL